MPAPNASLIQGLVLPRFVSDTSPTDGPKLAKAVAQPVAAACDHFTHRVQAAPGIVCVFQPTTFTGQVTGQGRLQGSPPGATEIRVQAASAARSAGIVQAEQDRFAETVSRLTALGLQRLVTLATTLPGVPIAGGVTTAPMRLQIPTSAIRAELEATAATMAATAGATAPAPASPPPTARPGGGWNVRPTPGARPASGPQIGSHRGVPRSAQGQPQGLGLPDGFAASVARTVGVAIDQMAIMVMVGPGIAVAGNVTATPGFLI